MHCHVTAPDGKLVGAKDGLNCTPGIVQFVINRAWDFQVSCGRDLQYLWILDTTQAPQPSVVAMATHRMSPVIESFENEMVLTPSHTSRVMNSSCDLLD